MLVSSAVLGALARKYLSEMKIICHHYYERSDSISADRHRDYRVGRRGLRAGGRHVVPRQEPPHRSLPC